MTLDIGVVGAGFAGSAAALFLHRLGHRVTVYEAVDDPLPVGGGILLQPTGMFVMEQLGLLDGVVRRGAVVDQLRCRTGTGRTLFRLAYSLGQEGLYGLGLHRGVLFQVLFDALESSGATVRCGVRVVDVIDGGRLRDDRGRVFGPHDLVVVADGARSQVRNADFPAALDEAYPWGALWFVAEDPQHIYRRELYQVVDGTHKMLGFLPTGCAPGSDTNLTSIFWSLEASQLESWRHSMRFRGIQRFRDQIVRFAPESAPLLDQIRDADQILFAAYRDVRLRRWHKAKHGTHMVVIGDAAHAMSPQLGQGSNLALYDAMVLGQVLDACEPESLGAALGEYQRNRQAHLDYYGRVNRWVTPFFQGRSSVLGWVRDLGFPIGSRLPVVHGAMVDTMAGVRRGVMFAEALPLPELPRVHAEQ